MFTTSETTQKASALTAKVAATINLLAETTDQVAVSAAIQNYLTAVAKFHDYSFLNSLLIVWSRPTATHVAGYNAWVSKFHRYVKRGEKGIPILAPIVIDRVKGDPDSGKAVWFKVVYVFDVAQTEGEPLPPEPDWKTPERLAWLETQLLAFAAANNIKVEIVNDLAGAEGVSSGGSIKLLETAGTRTLVHELAHELLHKSTSPDYISLTRAEKELEADATAWVVCNHFGLDAPQAVNYLALWNADGKKIREHLDRIQKAATKIIAAVAPELEVELVQ